MLLGGIAIAERHAQGGDEHARILAKTAAGCRFFVSQAVYDVTATKSLLSDYALETGRRGAGPGADRRHVVAVRLGEDAGVHEMAGDRVSTLAGE